MKKKEPLVLFSMMVVLIVLKFEYSGADSLKMLANLHDYEIRHSYFYLNYK